MNATHEPHSPAPKPVDSGSQALAEALYSSFAIVRFVMVLLVAVFFIKGFFIVGPQQKALILRFGKLTGEGDQALLGPGLHWSLPYPIDEVIRVPITEIQTIRSTVGWYATTPGQELAGTEPQPGPSLNPAVDGYVLTADGNIVHTRATLRYRFDDPLRCVFGFAGDTNRVYNLAGVSNTVQNALNNALLHAAARHTVDQILTRDVLSFQDALRRRFEQLARAQDLGVAVEQCEVQSRPPRYLKPAFDGVINAGLKRSKVMDQASSYANEVTNRAASEASATVNGAKAERTRYLEDLAADADWFREVLPKYERNPSLFVQLKLTETMGRVLTNAQEKFFLPQRADGQTRELRLLLNREPPKPRIETTP